MKKWKPFPCKECIIKKICKLPCIEWPDNHDHADHIEAYSSYICMACGGTIEQDYDKWPVAYTCGSCSIGHIMIQEMIQ